MIPQNKTDTSFNSRLLDSEHNIEVFKRKYKKMQDKSAALEEDIERIKKQIANQRNKCLQSVSEINRLAGERLVIDEKIVVKPQFILQKNDKPKQFLHFLVKNYSQMQAEQKALRAHYEMVNELIGNMTNRLNYLSQKTRSQKEAFQEQNNELCEQYIALKERYQNQISQNQQTRKRISQAKQQISSRHQEIQKLKAEIEALKPGYSQIKNTLNSKKESEDQKRIEYARLYEELKAKADAQERQLRNYQLRIDYLQKFKQEALIQLNQANKDPQLSKYK